MTKREAARHVRERVRPAEEVAARVKVAGELMDEQLGALLRLRHVDEGLGGTGGRAGEPVSLRERPAESKMRHLAGRGARRRRAEHSGGGYAASATRSGAWTGSRVSGRGVPNPTHQAGPARATGEPEPPPPICPALLCGFQRLALPARHSAWQILSRQHCGLVNTAWRKISMPSARVPHRSCTRASCGAVRRTRALRGTGGVVRLRQAGAFLRTSKFARTL
jgi:hypothetical protein